MDDSRIKQVSSLLETFFDKKTLSEAKNYVGLINAWPSIAGVRLSDHAKPVDIRHGALLIEAEHSGWIQLLRIEQESILREITRRYPELEISSLSIRVGNAEADKESKGEETRACEPREAPRAGLGSDPIAGAEIEGLPGDLVRVFEKIKKNIGADDSTTEPPRKGFGD